MRQLVTSDLLRVTTHFSFLENRMGMRTFSLNSREFYEAVCKPRERAWIPNGALPREPRLREPEVVVERSRRNG